MQKSAAELQRYMYHVFAILICNNNKEEIVLEEIVADLWSSQISFSDI